jgi:flagellar basal body-associated protein FliL
MVESDKHKSRYRRKRKHPYRLFVCILIAALAGVSLIYFYLFVHRAHAGSNPSTPTAPSVGDPDNTVQFK